MSQAPDLPGWAAAAVALLVLAGAALTLIGALGLVRLGSFFERAHAPTLGSTLGMALIVAGSIVCFSVLRSRLSLHELLIGVFLTLTAPVPFLLLGRAALYRERVDGRSDVPPAGVAQGESVGEHHDPAPNAQPSESRPSSV